MQQLFVGIIIGYIVGTICEKYLFTLGDLLLQRYSNNKQLEALKVQKLINGVESEIQLEGLDTQYEASLIHKDIYDIKSQMGGSDANLIGFDTNPYVKDEFDEDFDDFDEDPDEIEERKIGTSSKLIKNKIGF